jgi:kinetochore protein Spc7/SPC105
MPLAEIPPHRSMTNDRRQTGQENDDLTIKADELNASGTKVALKTEEEQQEAAREREDRERAELVKQAASEREARRKSLASRRVSFAAEATLHTFHEIEYMQDSTTSTDSTRRASSLAAQSPAPPPEQALGSDPSEPPSTPPQQVEESVPESPANQHGLHQRRGRRSSGAATLTLNSVNAEKAQGSVDGSDSDSGDEVVEVQTEEVSDSSQDSDEEDGTMMTLDEMTSASVASGASARSGSSRNSTSDLDEKLRLAAERARGGQNDTAENVAAEDDDDDGEIIPTFAGWIKKAVTQTDSDGTVNKPTPPPQSAEAGDETGEVEVEMDMTDNTGGIIPSVASSPFKEHDDEDMSMEVTSALGGILTKAGLQSRRQAIQRSPVRTVQDDSIVEDQTIDLTMAVGGIKASRESSVSDIEGNEDMSMELTAAVGGLLSAAAPKAWAPSGRRRSMGPKQTQAGRDEDGDATIGMDMTVPIGGIIQSSSPARAQAATTASTAKQRTPVSLKSPARKSPSKVPNNVDITGTPDFAAFHGRGLRRSSPTGDAAVSNAPNTTVVETPTKILPAMLIGGRSNSPKRPAPASKTAQPASPSKALNKSPGLFARNSSTGATTPKVVLTPQRRRLSGVGADRSGLGSPQVAAILDRRTSLGDAAAEFVPGQDASTACRKVAFEDPRTLELEIDRERQEEEDKENGRKILEREADGDATLTLKEMISGLSPKKPIGKGRKSLHVGSAKGLLGKRPAELDDADEEEEPRDGVKRLKNHQGSPVKNVKLQAPPSKAETTGRTTRAGRKNLGIAGDDITTPTITLTMSGDGTAPLTPKDHGRFRNVEDDHPTATIDFSRASPGKTDAALPEIDANGEPRIHLQDFLNMTNIRFLELTTTKRRHTVAPGEGAVGLAEDDADNVSLERCVVAGACTVPMLELYQHSCRELKKYISEGRRIVKEIETEAFEENPPLFKEYLSASPEFKNLMDNQFKNVKAHARLLSKAMWYEWRMKLQDGLKEGLVKMLDGMAEDEQSIEKQKKLLDLVLPRLIERFEFLERECGDLELAAQELADCDPADLKAARADLVEVDEDIRTKKAKIAELEEQLQDTEATLVGLKEQKQNSLEAIAASEKIREECRGWTTGEVTAMRGMQCVFV